MHQPKPPTSPQSLESPEAIQLRLRYAPIDAAQLLGATGEVKLLHNGDLYSLRRTRQGKLILTK